MKRRTQLADCAKTPTCAKLQLNIQILPFAQRRELFQVLQSLTGIAGKSFHGLTTQKVMAFLLAPRGCNRGWSGAFDDYKYIKYWIAS